MGGSGRKGSGKGKGSGRKWDKTKETASTTASKIPDAPKAVPLTKVGPPANAKSLGSEADYEVVHNKVVVRSAPATDASIRSVVKQGLTVSGTPYEVKANPWLLLSDKSCAAQSLEPADAWMLIDGKCVGLGELLKKVESQEAPVKEAPKESSQEVSADGAMFDFDGLDKVEDSSTPEAPKETADASAAGATPGDNMVAAGADAAAGAVAEAGDAVETPVVAAQEEATPNAEPAAPTAAASTLSAEPAAPAAAAPAPSAEPSAPAAAVAAESVQAAASEDTPKLTIEPEVTTQSVATIQSEEQPRQPSSEEPPPSRAAADSAEQPSDEATQVTEPANDLAEAVECLKQLTATDIDAVKAARPPAPEGLIVCQAVCIMLGYHSLMKDLRGEANLWWKTFQAQVDSEKLLQDLVAFNKDDIPARTIQAVTPYIERPDFDPEAVKKVSIACLALCLWVRAIHSYYIATKGPVSVTPDGGAGGPAFAEEMEGELTEVSIDGLLRPGELSEDDIAGDYQWRSRDGLREGVLRLRPGGQWWHAAHRSTSGNHAMGPEAVAATSLGMNETQHWKGKMVNGTKTWEMAESLGSWRKVPGNVILLTCEYCRWASEKPDAPLVLRPSRQRMLEMDDLVASGMVVFHYVPSKCSASGRRRLDLKSAAGHPVSLGAAKVLGFVRGYREGEPDDSEDNLGGFPSEQSPLLTQAQEVCTIL